MRSLAYATGGVRQKRSSPRSLGGGEVSCRGYPSGATGQPGTAVEMRAPVKYSQEAVAGLTESGAPHR